MNPEDAQQKKRVLDSCICRQCPSFVECTEDVGYCFPAAGKSKCITEENGCICPACPVTAEMNLKHQYFCTKGSEKEQSGSV